MRLLIFMKSSKSKERGAPPLSSPTHTTPLPITTIMSDGGGAAAGGPPPSGQQSMTSFLPPHDGAAAVAAPLAPRREYASSEADVPRQGSCCHPGCCALLRGSPRFPNPPSHCEREERGCILRGEVGCTARRRDGAPLRQAFCLPRERRVSKLAAAAEAQKRVVHRSHTALERRPRHHHGEHKSKTTEVSVAD